VSETTIPVVVGVPVVMGAVSLIQGDDELMKDAIYIGLASGINMGLTYGLKYSINRTRPYNAYPGFIVPDLYEDSPSFPSGHTSGAFATATALSLKYPRWYVVAPAFAWAGYVGYSRMHTGVHYPSDVVAGALLGAGSAWLTYRFNQWLWSKYNIDGIKLHKKR
jgi:membrane-associated phospholipid phosphatase